MKKCLILISMMLVFIASAFAAEVPTEKLISAEELSVQLGLPIDSGNTAYDNHDYRDEITCFAHNLRGDHFEASGFDPYRVQAHVMEKCYRISRHCFEDGCRHY
jgi:hypothetical protein